MIRRLALAVVTAVAATIGAAAPASAQTVMLERVAQIRVAPPPTGGDWTPPVNRTRALADARQWNEALRLAVGGPAQDKLYVLLAFRNSSANDAERASGQRFIWRNMSIFEGALSAASPPQRRQLEDMRTAYNRELYNQYVHYQTYGRRYGATPPPYVPPHTTEECRRRGGTVTARQTCQW